MKIFSKILPLFFCFSAFANAEVVIFNHQLEIDESLSQISLTIEYRGCKNQEFTLTREGCLESSPVKCNAYIEIQENEKSCTEKQTKILTYTLEELHLVGDYYDGGSFRVFNLKDYSKASIPLPRSCNFYQEVLDRARNDLNAKDTAWREWAIETVANVSQIMEEKNCE